MAGTAENLDREDNESEGRNSAAKALNKGLDIAKILSYFKGVLIIFLIIMALSVLGVTSFYTVYFMQKIKYNRIMRQLDAANPNKAPSYGYTEAIVIRGKAVPPESFIFQIGVVLAYNEKEEKVVGPFLESQRSMIQDQIRTYFSSQLNSQLDGETENTLKRELKEWLNTLLSGEYIQEIYFTDYMVDY
ncbi:MAG: flagellar basal body-associated FliL family protein [Spirochaetia bacterium]